MIVSAIVDPEIFGPASIQDTATRDKCLALLKGLATNGVWIDKSKANSLLGQAINLALGLDSKLGQRVLVALQELKKDWKRQVAAFGKLEDRIEDGDFAGQAKQLYDQAKPDGVFVSEANRTAIETKEVPSGKIHQIGELYDCGYEQLRIELLEPEKPLNELTQAEIENLIGRTLKFSSCLHLFDYKMAVDRRSARGRFLPGIQQLLKIWDKVFVFESSIQRTLCLYPISERGATSGQLCEEVDQILDECIATRLQTQNHIN